MTKESAVSVIIPTRNRADWQFRLGDLYYHQERMKIARKYFLQALKNKPCFRYFRAIIKTILGKKVSEGLISGKISLIRMIYGKN